jgi:hypothetical protein
MASDTRCAHSSGPAAEERAIAAFDADGRSLGRVEYRRVYGPRAALTLDVEDAHWHRGLPATLLADACAQAAAEGISTFLMRARAGDVRLLALLREEFAAREVRDGAFVDVELATAPRSPARRTTAQEPLLGRMRATQAAERLPV